VPDSSGAGQRVTFGQVFAVAEYRALWATLLVSLVGDQLARVAITVLVFDRTHSALLSALTYATSIVPMFVGGLTLSGLADRLPRRALLIAIDLISGALVIAMAVPGMPLAVLIVLLFAVTMASAPYIAARTGMLPEILKGDLYAVGNALSLTTSQLAQVIGAAAGGAVVGFLGVRTSLVADALTFGFAALLVRTRVRARPAARPQPTAPARPPGGGGAGAGPARQVRQAALAGPTAGLRLALGRGGLRTPLLLGWLATFYAVPEGVAAPLARSAGGGAVTTGLILAAIAFGTMTGLLLFSRLVAPPQRFRWTKPLAVVTCATLMLMAVHPAIAGILVILTISGLASCYQLSLNVLLVQAVPAEWRGQVNGIANAGLSLGQGGGMILVGAAAQRFPVSSVVAGSGFLGALFAVVITLTAIPAARRARSAASPGPGLALPAPGMHTRHPPPLSGPGHNHRRAPGRHRRPKPGRESPGLPQPGS
jgi:predicted MFS family arabinose efflux permease